MKRLITSLFLSAKVRKSCLILFAVLLASHSWAQPICNATFVYYSNHNPDSIHFYPTGGSTSGSHYYWTFGDGDTSTSQTPWHYYASAGIYYACLTVTDSTSNGSCTNTNCDSVSVNMPPICNAHFTFVPSTHNSDSVLFSSASNPASSQYGWNFGDGGNSSAANPWHFYSSAGTYYVCHEVNDSTANGTCHDVWCDSVHITGNPPNCNANFSYYASNTNPDSVHFYPTGSNASGTHYYWYFGDGDSSTAQYPWHLYASAGTYYACLVVRDSTPNGTCHETHCDSVQVGPPPHPICNSHFSFYLNTHNTDSVHFYPTYANPTGTQYYWTFGDGNSSMDQYPWHLYADSGMYYVCLTVSDSTANGSCTETHCDSVHVVALPPPPPPICNAHFYHYSSVHNLDSVHFYPPTNPTGSHYYWTFGDGTNSTNQDPWHLYATTGTYYACLTVTDSTSSGTCSDTWCDSIHVTAPPPPVCNAYFTYYFNTHNTDSAHFISPSNPTGTQYYWNFGDGHTSTDPYPWHLYATTGTYYVCLTVTDSTSNGTCTQTHCDSVHLSSPPPPVCNAHFYHYSLTNNADSVHFYSASNPTGTHYYWTFGDGNTSTDQYPWHLYASAGVYYVCLTVSDSTASGTCHDTQCDSIRVNLNPPPVCNALFHFYFSPHNPDSAHFYPANNLSGAHYFWTFGDGNTSTDQYPWHLYASAGTYYVCLTVTDSTASGSCTDTHCDSVHVNVQPPPVCNAHFYHYSINNPDSVHFYPSTNAAGTHYYWSFGDGDTSTAQYPWHFYATTGTYFVCLTVSDSTASGTCHTDWCDSVHVAAPPPPVCNAQFGYYNSSHNLDSIHFYLSSAPSAGSQFYWTFGDGGTSTNQDPWHLYATTGTYYVCLTVSDSTASGSCTSTWCDSIQILPPPPPPSCDAHFAHYSGSNQDSVHFYPTGNNAAGTHYLWMFGDGTYSTNQYPWHFYSYSGTFTVCLNVTDSNASGQCHETWCDTLFAPQPMPRPYIDPSVYYIPVNENDASRLSSQQPAPVVNVYMKDYITISLQNLVKPVNVRFFDSVGRQIYQVDGVVDGTYNLSNISIRQGLYYYDVNDDSQTISKGKLIIVQ